MMMPLLPTTTKTMTSTRSTTSTKNNNDNSNQHNIIPPHRFIEHFIRERHDLLREAEKRCCDFASNLIHELNCAKQDRKSTNEYHQKVDNALAALRVLTEKLGEAVVHCLINLMLRPLLRSFESSNQKSSGRLLSSGPNEARRASKVAIAAINV